MRSQAAMIAAAGAVLAACAPAPQSSPTWIACKASGADAARRATACATLIRQGGRPEDLASAYRLHGEALYDQNEPTAALADFDAALRLEPGDATAYDARGRAELDLNTDDKASADFTMALKLDPRDADALTNLGYLALLRSDLPTAFRDDDRAIELKPDWAGPWLERGRAFLAERRYDMALADFAEATRLDATLTDPLEAAAEALIGKNDVKGALTAYGQAEGVYIGKGDYKSAIDDTDRALSLAPADPETLNASCWTRAIANTDLDAAAADCQKSLAVRPRAADVLDSLAFVEYRQGHLAASIQDYTAALAQDPKLASSLYMRGVARLQSGDTGGQSDLDAAKGADGSVAATFAGYGVNPPGGGQGAN